MIVINKNSENIIILELSLSSIYYPNSNYVFEFIRDLYEDEKIYFTTKDLSTWKSRYNKFKIIETASTYSDYANGIINLRPGSYTYNIFESSASTISVSATTMQIIDTGKVMVNGESEIDEIYN